MKQEVAGNKIVTLLLKDTTKSDRRLSFNSMQNRNFPPQLVITGDTINSSTQKAARSALISNTIVTNSMVSNTALAASRAVYTDAAVPVVSRENLIKKIPSCDEPSDGYDPADSVAAPASATITAPVINKIHVFSNVNKPTIYPNPTQNVFHVRFPGSYQGKYRLQMIDPVGRAYELGTATLQHGGADITIDISRMSLKPGLYFLNISSDSKSESVLKLVIQY